MLLPGSALLFNNVATVTRWRALTSEPCQPQLARCRPTFGAPAPQS